MNHPPINQLLTYIDDEEVEPAPVVGEVLLEAVGEPLEQHLQDEDVGEDLVCVLQHHLDHPPLLDVDVLKGLKGAAERRISATSAGSFKSHDPSDP